MHIVLSVGLFSRCCGRGSETQTVSQPLLNTTAPTPAVQDAQGAAYVPPPKAEMTATVTVPYEVPKAADSQVPAPVVPDMVDSSPATETAGQEPAADTQQVLIDLEDSQPAQPVSPAAAAPTIEPAVETAQPAAPAVVQQEAAVEQSANLVPEVPAQPTEAAAASPVQTFAPVTTQPAVESATKAGVAEAGVDSSTAAENPLVKAAVEAAAAPVATDSTAAAGGGGRGGNNSQSGGRGGGGGKKNNRGGGGNKGGGGRGGGKKGKGKR